MRKLFVAIASALLVGFVLGNLTARQWSPFFEVRERQIGGEASTAGNMSSEIEYNASPSNQHRQLENNKSLTAAVQDPDHVDTGDLPGNTWNEHYPEAPPLDPPHVADPYFYGPDLTDPSILRMRAVALEDHTRSLLEAGVPKAVIQAAVAEFERDFEMARKNLQGEIRIKLKNPMFTPEKLTEDPKDQ
jgi:hypothetical protein